MKNKTMLMFMSLMVVCGMAPRPGRNEPRMVTKKRKHYPKPKVTRYQWRKRIAA